MQVGIIFTGWWRSEYMNAAAATYDNFTSDLFAAEQGKECRYAVFDAEYEGGAGMQKNKILFFMWSVISDGFCPH